MTDRQQAVLNDANQKAVSLGKLLVSRMRDLAEQLEREADRLDADLGYHVNNCGVVQSRGLDIDMLCARFQDAKEHMLVLGHALKQ